MIRAIRKFYAEGQLMTSFAVDDNNIPIGHFVVWNPDGQKIAEYNFKEGDFMRMVEERSKLMAADPKNYTLGDADVYFTMLSVPPITKLVISEKA